MLRSNSKSMRNRVVSHEEENERLQWEGFAEKEGSNVLPNCELPQVSSDKSPYRCNNCCFVFKVCHISLVSTWHGSVMVAVPPAVRRRRRRLG